MEPHAGSEAPITEADKQEQAFPVVSFRSELVCVRFGATITTPT
jgi:hypothetical protein